MTFPRVEKSRERRDTRDASFPDAGCANVDNSGWDTFTRNAVSDMEVTTAVQHTAAVVASWPTLSDDRRASFGLCRRSPHPTCGCSAPLYGHSRFEAVDRQRRGARTSLDGQFSTHADVRERTLERLLRLANGRRGAASLSRAHAARAALSYFALPLIQKYRMSRGRSCNYPIAR